MSSSRNAAIAAKDLLSIEELSPADIGLILDTAAGFAETQSRSLAEAASKLGGRTLVNMFFENSTRTRTSFEIAAGRLGMRTVNLDVSTSSVHKGETLLDTAKVVEAMGAEFLVIRHAASGAAHLVARNVSCRVINAGDGQHQHPTQALLDALTIRQVFGRIEGLRVAIVGDILHSRVARSNTQLLTRLGATIALIGPRAMVPDAMSALAPNVEVFHDLRSGLESAGGAHVVMCLRLQLERHRTPIFPSAAEYRRTYGLDEKSIGWAHADAIVLHPGPVNRGVELSSGLLDSRRSFVLRQVSNGPLIRAAVLALLGEKRG